MRTSEEMLITTSTSVEKEVQACVWLSTFNDKPYTVNFMTGTSADACMKRYGNAASMQVRGEGMTCISLGDVEVDDDGLCYWKSSRWGMSYAVDGKSYSGYTESQWVTGPANTHIELKNQSPGTNVCGSEVNCESKKVEWSNSNNDPIYVSNVYTKHQTASSVLWLLTLCRSCSSLGQWKERRTCNGGQLAFERGCDIVDRMAPILSAAEVLI